MLPITFKETDLDDSGRYPDKLQRSERRRRVRQELEQATASAQQKIVEAALAEMERLLPPHLTFEEYKARNDQWSEQSRLSREEVVKRSRAVQEAQQAQSVTMRDRTLRMLRLATDPDLQAKIISRVSSEDALNLAEQIEDARLRDMLVLRSLEAAE